MRQSKKTFSITIVAALITLAGTITAAVIGIIPSLRVIEHIELPAPLPTGLPSPTPLPTVVGTPIDVGGDMVASGPVGFTIKVYGVSLVVDEALAYQTNSIGYTEIPGYTNLLVKLRIANENPSIYVWNRDILVVDDYSNQYRSWGGWGSDFPEISSVEYGQSASGALVYRIPIAALNNKPRLVLETSSFESNPLVIRLIVPLGVVPIQ